MHNFDLILTLTGGLVSAVILGYITQRMRLSPIVGYLLAGIIVGPHTPGFVADLALAEQLAEIGVVLLMFGVGLQFHIEDLLAVRKVAIPGAIVQSLAATALGAAVAYYSGWSLPSGVVFGVALSVASTVVLVRVLSDNRQLHTPTGHIAVGWLVVEDLFTVLVLVLMPTIFGGAQSAQSLRRDQPGRDQDHRLRARSRSSWAAGRFRGCSRTCRARSRASCSRSPCWRRRSGLRCSPPSCSASRWPSARFWPG